MDWEKSRGKLLKSNNEEQEKAAPISVWRKVMIANDFVRLQVSSL